MNDIFKIKPDIFVVEGNEHLYQEMVKLGSRLGVPVPQTFIETQVWVNGRTIHHQQKRSHTWVRNAYNHLFSQLAAMNADGDTFAGGYINIKDTGGTLRYGAYPIGLLPTASVETSSTDGYYAAAGDAGKGIVVGSSSTAWSYEHYGLQTLIANGTGAGQLSYIESEALVDSYVAGTKTMSCAHARFFNNNSGDTVNVEEAAIYVDGRVANAGNTWIPTRDLTGTVAIPNTGQLKVTYTISLVYSA